MFRIYTLYIHGMISSRGGQMKTITKIAKQKKNKQRYSIYLNDEYAFGVEEEMILKHHLYKGKELTLEMVNELLDDEELQKFYVKALNHISYRMRTIAEVETYLRKEEAEEMVLQKVIVRLLEENYLNDETYAKAFVADRKLLTSKGPVLIQRELIQKGVSEAIAIQAVDYYTIEEQLEKASKWAMKEWKKKSKHPTKKRKEQLYVKLIQKGFHKDLVSRVIAALHIEDSAQTDQEILQKEIDKITRRHARKYTGYELKMRIKATLYQRGFGTDVINEYMEKIEESL